MQEFIIYHDKHPDNGNYTHVVAENVEDALKSFEINMERTGIVPKVKGTAPLTWRK